MYVIRQNKKEGPVATPAPTNLEHAPLPKGDFILR